MATREEQMELSTVERNYEGGLRLSEDVAKEFASGPKYWLKVVDRVGSMIAANRHEFQPSALLCVCATAVVVYLAHLLYLTFDQRCINSFSLVPWDIC
ncbi:hypothetical protein ACEPPN_014090 [Leptodophora sp. 'Broadleaf-Isolate-01']